MATKGKPQEASPDDLQAELDDAFKRILLSTARQYLAKLEETPLGELKAADLTSATKFLSDNNITKEILEDPDDLHRRKSSPSPRAVREAAEMAREVDIPPLPEPRLED